MESRSSFVGREFLRKSARDANFARGAMWLRRLLVPGFLACIAAAPACADEGPADCNPPERTEQLWRRADLQFVVLGEFHGTEEIPAAFAEMVCSALAAGREVLVGLEFPEEARPAFQAYLDSPGAPADRNRLIEAAFGDEDGTGSEALFRMVERFRQWRRAGRPLAITAFRRRTESDPAEGQTPHEKGMAASLLEAAAQDPDALVLVLVGNIHARKLTLEVGEDIPAIEPMAMHLPPSRTLGLVAVHDGGESWSCLANPDGTLDCGRHVREPTVLGADAPPGLHLGPELSGGWDGFVKLGRITASQPRKPSVD